MSEGYDAAAVGRVGAGLKRASRAPLGHRVQVRQFLRAPVPGMYSVERLFKGVRDALPTDISVRLHVNRRPSRGLIPRFRDALTARRNRGMVNHVLGDVHYLTWFLPGASTLLTVLDCVSLEQRVKGWRRWLLWLLWYWWPLRRVGHVSVISEFSRRALLSWVRHPRGLITVIPPPLSPDFTYDPPRPHAEWRRLLHIGSAPNKNLWRIMEAVVGLDVTLVTIGTMSADAKANAMRLNLHIENYEELDGASLIEQFRSADILVFASTYEGFGMPIVEAQAIGRPVVTSNVASMPEAAGGAACLVDPFDIASIRTGICTILKDEAYALRLIEAGRGNARKYDREIIANQYAGLYREIAEQANGVRKQRGEHDRF